MVLLVACLDLTKTHHILERYTPFTQKLVTDQTATLGAAAGKGRGGPSPHVASVSVVNFAG